MRRLIIYLIMLLSLNSCTYYAPPGESHASRVVTQIHITASANGQEDHYRYDDPEKLRFILNYLRQLEPDLTADIDPDTFRADSYRIVLTLSDGQQTVYHQLYDEYLQVDGGPWRSIDTHRGAMLQSLLQLLPSDRL